MFHCTVCACVSAHCGTVAVPHFPGHVVRDTREVSGQLHGCQTRFEVGGPRWLGHAQLDELVGEINLDSLEYLHALRDLPNPRLGVLGPRLPRNSSDNPCSQSRYHTGHEE